MRALASGWLREKARSQERAQDARPQWQEIDADGVEETRTRLDVVRTQRLREGDEERCDGGGVW